MHPVFQKKASETQRKPLCAAMMKLNVLRKLVLKAEQTDQSPSREDGDKTRRRAEDVSSHRSNQGDQRTMTLI